MLKIRSRGGRWYNKKYLTTDFWTIEKLKAEDANTLVRKLLQSIIINDDLDDSLAIDNGAESGAETRKQLSVRSECYL